jgi:predicted metal-dependent enzyme (double-stranded beta helix superfamily)
MDSLFERLERIYHTTTSLSDERVAQVEAALADTMRAPRANDFLRSLLGVNYDFSKHGASHKHHNGFEKLTLYRSKNCGFTVRLHVWWPGEGREPGTIHNHRWNFTSVLLVGQMKEIIYEDQKTRPTGPHSEKRALQLSDAGPDGSKAVIDLGTRYLVASAWYVLCCPSIHGLRWTDIHQACPVGDGLCATLIVVDAADSCHSVSYRDQDVSFNSTSSLNLYGNSTIEAIIEKFLSFD